MLERSHVPWIGTAQKVQPNRARGLIHRRRSPGSNKRSKTNRTTANVKANARRADTHRRERVRTIRWRPSTAKTNLRGLIQPASWDGERPASGKQQNRAQPPDLAVKTSPAAMETSPRKAAAYLLAMSRVQTVWSTTKEKRSLNSEGNQISDRL